MGKFTPAQLADELMAMAPTVEAATAEGGAAILREAAYQLRICADLLEALLAQEELAALRMPGDPTTNIVKVRNMRRAAIAKATA